MLKKFRTVPPLLLVLILPLLPILAYGADATSFNPVPIHVAAKSSGGVPVGTIIAWPVATNPEDMDKWLECNGQTINPTVYPELAALIGGSVPDYRGLFLRGIGGNSGPLGVKQEDVMRDGVGKGTIATGVPVFRPNYRSGPFSTGNGEGWNAKGDTGWNFTSSVTFDFTAGVPTGPEFRPVNMAVRYLIRAAP